MMLVRSRPSEVSGNKEGYEIGGTRVAEGGFRKVDIEAWS